MAGTNADSELEKFTINKAEVTKAEYLKFTGDTINRLGADCKKLKAQLEAERAKVAMLREALLDAAVSFAQVNRKDMEKELNDALSKAEIDEWLEGIKLAERARCEAACKKIEADAWMLKGTKDWTIYVEGASDGAGECADAIREMK